MYCVNASAAKKFQSSPAVVRSVHFDGIERTRDDGINREIYQLWSVATLKELVVKAYAIQQHMRTCGLFDQIDVIIDVNRNSPESAPHHYDVIFQVKEPSRIKGNVNAGINNRGEANTGLELNLANIWGRGESATAEFQVGHQKTNQLHVGLVKPLLNGRLKLASAGLHLMRNYSEFRTGGYSVLENCLNLDLKYKSNPHWFHNLKVEGNWRQLGCLSRTAPFDIRLFSGHSLKASLKHILTYSSLNDQQLPSKGILMRLTNELAGFGGQLGNVDFLRNDLDVKTSTKLPLGFFMVVGGNISTVVPTTDRPLSVIDRTFLGGVTNLRGFELNGVSNTQQLVGGMASWAAAAHLYRPLVPRNLLYAHLFAVCGNISSGSQWDWQRTWNELNLQPRYTVGAGVSVKLGQIAQLELNYCWPVSRHPYDKQVPGVQFGVGVDFV